jgi:hypothetical protein
LISTENNGEAGKQKFTLIGHLGEQADKETRYRNNKNFKDF